MLLMYDSSVDREWSRQISVAESPAKNEGASDYETATDDEENSTDAPLMHESSLNQRPSRQKVKKYTKPEETKNEKNDRTIFIGNLPVEIAKTKVTIGLVLLSG